MSASESTVEVANNWKTLGACAYSSKKPYMDYRMITDQSSKQYQLIHSAMIVQDNGLLTTVDGYVGVALGSVYGDIGTRYRVTTDAGQVFYVIKIDEKSDEHTTNGCKDSSGAIIEFVIDIESASLSEHSNAIYDGSFNSSEQFKGVITNIEMETTK